MSRVLVVYATREGQTAKGSERIATRIGTAGHQVEPVNASDLAIAAAIDLDAFQLLVVGASMHAGGVSQGRRGRKPTCAGTMNTRIGRRSTPMQTLCRHG